MQYNTIKVLNLRQKIENEGNKKILIDLIVFNEFINDDEKQQR